MTDQAAGRRRTTILFVLVCSLGLAVPGRADDLSAVNSSLRLAPADAAFYSATLRAGEQVEAIGRSQAWKRLTELPLVKMGLQLAHAEMNKADNPAGQLLAFLAQPENQDLLPLLGDLFAHEFYAFGGPRCIDFLELVNRVSSSTSATPTLAQLQGQAPDKGMGFAILQTLQQHARLIHAPEVVFGFKLSNPARVEKQLKRLENLLQGLIAQGPPQLKGRLERRKVGGGDMLVLSLDGGMVPWEQVPFNEFELKPGDFDELQKRLKALKLTITLGVRDSHLLFAIGESTAVVENLGKGKSLASVAEMKPLARHASARLTAIGYSSKELNTRLGMTPEDIDEMFATAKTLLGVTPLAEDVQKRILKDLDLLGKDLKAVLPKPGAALSYAFLTERGQETYSYDWASGSALAADRPLTLLNHVGGSPLLALVGRSNSDPENYQTLVKWVKTLYSYVDEFVLPMLPPNEKGLVEGAINGLLPSIKRLDEITAKMLLPALKDGQTALVLDAKITSKRWHAELPETKTPLPMLELGIVCGVSDATLLTKAFVEYRKTLNEMATKLSEVIPGFPAIEVPAAESRKVAGGTLYYYTLPEVGQDKQLLPNVGVGATAAAFTLAPATTERLLVKTPLKVQSGPLADLSKPRAGAFYFDWAGTVKAATPWVEWSVQQVATQVPAEATGGDLVPQVRTILQVLATLKSVSVSTYVEGGVTVTHTETVVSDL